MWAEGRFSLEEYTSSRRNKRTWESYACGNALICKKNVGRPALKLPCARLPSRQPRRFYEGA